MQRQPTRGEFFFSLNRSRKHLKFLPWEREVLVLHYRRLEQGTFGMDGSRRTGDSRCIEKKNILWLENSLFVVKIS
ncbi:IS66 family insertion sequence element accessory protein TnpB [Sphingobacterium oryzagri]|uniref:IS66 family insertion sequence element accessory protein TnpB n=1 Tax=Sphingobacterium oryzagri TaxID=3025669 RepID=UPI003D174473